MTGPAQYRSYSCVVSVHFTTVYLYSPNPLGTGYIVAYLYILLLLFSGGFLQSEPAQYSSYLFILLFSDGFVQFEPTQHSPQSSYLFILLFSGGFVQSEPAEHSSHSPYLLMLPSVQLVQLEPVQHSQHSSCFSILLFCAGFVQSEPAQHISHSSYLFTTIYFLAGSYSSNPLRTVRTVRTVNCSYVIMCKQNAMHPSAKEPCRIWKNLIFNNPSSDGQTVVVYLTC
jgi:hypothetical protein